MFVFQINLGFEAKLFEIWQNFSTESSKRQFTCREEHYDENIVGFLKQISILSEKISDLRRKNCSLVIKSALLSPDGQLEKNFWRKFYFVIFFGRPGNNFWFFSLYQSRHGDPNWIPPAKRNISIRKNFKRKFLSFPYYERNFLNIHWSLLGMLSELVYFFIGALWEKFFYSIFSKLFSDFER